MNIKNLLPLLVFAFLLGNSVESSAQKFGYINAQELLAELEEVKEANKELEVYQSQLLARGQQMMQDFETDYRKYMEEAQAGTLSKVQAQKREETLVQKQEEIQNYEQEVQEKLGKKRETLYKPILDKAKNVIEAYGKENGYTMIFDISSGFILHALEGDNLMDVIKEKMKM
jgi:outer membrane protein